MASYTDLDEVRRILRSSDREVVRFSDSITSIRAKAADTSRMIGFNESLLEVDPSFDEKLELRFEFTSDTEFNLLKLDRMLEREVAIGTGDRSQEYETPDGMFTIPAACWIGDIQAEDVVTIQFDPHMSDQDALRYIEDTEVEIDSTLSANQIRFSEEVDPGDRYFDPDPTSDNPLPSIISVATTYLAAYYIYTDVFVNILKEGGPQGTYAGRWKGRAERYIRDYIKAEGYSNPRAIAFPRYIDKFGVPEEGPGMKGMSEHPDQDAETESIFKRQYSDLGAFYNEDV